MATQTKSIPVIQVIMIKAALKAQKAGMRLSRKVPAGTTLARQMLGMRGNLDSLLEQVEDLLEQYPTSEHGHFYRDES